LGIASLYAFAIPLKRSLGLIDAVVLLGLFGAYLWRTALHEREEPDLHGFAAEMAALPTTARRTLVVIFFVVAAAVIGFSAKPFADGLVTEGRTLGMDEFLLV
jgi:cation:H+ antiporter